MYKNKKKILFTKRKRIFDLTMFILCANVFYLLLRFRFNFINEYTAILDVLCLLNFLILLLIWIKEVRKYKSLFDFCHFKNYEKRIVRNLVESNNINHMHNISGIIEVPDVHISRDVDESGTLVVEVERLPNMNDIDDISRNINLSFNGKYQNYIVYQRYSLDNQKRYVFKLRDLSEDLAFTPTNALDFLQSKKNHFILQKGLHWNYAKHCHAIISGKSGSGKTTLILSLLMQMMLRGHKIYVIDCKAQLGVLDFMESNFASKKEDILNMLDEIIVLMNSRQEEINEIIKNGNGKYGIGATAFDVGLVPVFVILDEMSALVARLDSKEKKEFDSKITQIVQMGRSLGINLISSMQNANATDTIKVAIRNQFHLRVLLGDNTSEDIGFIFGKVDADIQNNVPVYTGYYKLDNKIDKFYVPNLYKHNLDSIELFKEIWYKNYL